jgi:hypothetical protein
MDKLHGAYGPVMAILNSPGAPCAAPASIQKLTLNNPHDSSMSYMVLVVPTHQPNSPGLINGMPTVSKYMAHLGQPVPHTVGKQPVCFHTQCCASIHDVVGNQILSTVHFPTHAFTPLGQGAFYQVPLMQFLDAAFSADPTIGTF